MQKQALNPTQQRLLSVADDVSLRSKPGLRTDSTTLGPATNTDNSPNCIRYNGKTVQTLCSF